MRCDWVEERLVAFRDGELSPGEATFVEEHVARCPACAEHDAALMDATPEHALTVPPEVLARMIAAVDASLDEAVDGPRRAAVRPGALGRWARWLRRDRDMPNAAVLGYSVLLAACVGWGLSNWLALQQMRDDTPARVAATASDAVVPSGAALPSDQYQPASWSPEDPAEPWR